VKKEVEKGLGFGAIGVGLEECTEVQYGQLVLDRPQPQGELAA
jgi:hypothetical protein